jgi:phosphoglycerate dehydrogenase-like enzyme
MFRTAIQTILLAFVATSAAVSQQAPRDPGAALIARFTLPIDRSPSRARPNWAAPKKIVALGDTSFATRLRAVAPGADVFASLDVPTVLRALPGADVFIGLCTADVLRASSALKWIQLASAGADPCASLPELTQRNILLTNAQGIYGPQIADHVMATILAFSRKAHRFIAEQKTEQWSIAIANPNDIAALGLWELEGKNLLVIGLGGIGTEVARRAHGFGMRVRATRNSGRDGPPFVEYVGLANEAMELAKWADVVVNCTPLTPDTRGMFNARFFAAMKPTAYFINAGRGESVVTDDLVAALRAGRIAGAGLDVTNPEPLPRGHPLWQMPNVILSPHIAVASDQVFGRYYTLAIENVRRWVAGEPLVSVVDVRRGY